MIHNNRNVILLFKIRLQHFKLLYCKIVKIKCLFRQAMASLYLKKMGYVFHFKIKPRFWQPRIRGPTPTCLFLLSFCRLYIISPWIGTTQIHFVRGMYVCCMFVCLTGVIICLLCLATLGWAANSSEGKVYILRQ